MAKNKTEKEFNFKLYAVIVFFGVLAALIAIVYTTFTSRYTAFHPEAVAKTYVDTIVQTGDGYNAYKNSLLGKSQKYGDFIREYYMYPVIDRDVNAELDALTDSDIPKGYNNDSFKGEKTVNDDGSLQGQLIDTMYPYYEELVSTNGWDNYDLIFTSYFDKLVEERKAIFGDDYMTDEIMFTALEANVRSYGEKLTGTEDEFDENTGMQTSVETEGVYEKTFGEDYRIATEVTAEKDLELEAYLAAVDEKAFESYKVSKEDIGAVKELAVKVTCGEKEAEVSVVAVQIGRSWYVDSAKTDTAALYSFAE